MSLRILCSNDDGIHAEGLETLEKIARELSDDVWVVAPETDQSGAARSLAAVWGWGGAARRGAGKRWVLCIF